LSWLRTDTNTKQTVREHEGCKSFLRCEVLPFLCTVYKSMWIGRDIDPFCRTGESREERAKELSSDHAASKQLIYSECIAYPPLVTLIFFFPPLAFECLAWQTHKQRENFTQSARNCKDKKNTMLMRTQLLLGVLIVAVGYSLGYQWRAPGAPLVQVDPWGVDSLRVRISNANQIVAVPPVQVTPYVKQSLYLTRYLWFHHRHYCQIPLRLQLKLCTNNRTPFNFSPT